MRKGFTLIEIIVAIIIIAIVSVSIPTVIGVTKEANKKLATQEVLFNTRTFIDLILRAGYDCKYAAQGTYDDKMPRFSNNLDFYTQKGLTRTGDENKRKILSVSESMYKNPRSVSSCDESNNEIGILSYKNDHKTIKAEKNKRDFLATSDYIADVNLVGEDPFNAGHTNPGYDFIKVEVNATYLDNNKTGLVSIVANIGDAPKLETKEIQ